jgi:hypothetical protein
MLMIYKKRAGYTSQAPYAPLSILPAARLAFLLEKAANLHAAVFA